MVMIADGKEEVHHGGTETRREERGEGNSRKRTTSSSVGSTTRCCANLAQGMGSPGAGCVPVMTEALCQIRATASREEEGSMEETGLLRASVSPW